MTGFIEAHRGRFGVEPICRVMAFSPSTYWAARSRPPSQRSLRDAQLKPEIVRVHKENYGVYGAHKLWRQLNREGIRVARCTVARLMRELGLRGVRRGKRCRTTVADESASALRTSSAAALSPPVPTSSGSRTSPTCAPGRASATPPS
jgi:putative transposase